MRALYRISLIASHIVRHDFRKGLNLKLKPKVRRHFKEKEGISENLSFLEFHKSVHINSQL